MERIDRLLVKLKKAETRSKAKALILAGKVFVNEYRVEKAGMMVSEDVDVKVRTSGRKFASRGGHKLEGALRRFNISPEGLVVLDAGSSTGGFTDCLLQCGARKIFAVDVGYGQLDYRLQKDDRVIPLFRRNVRYLKPEEIGTLVDMITADLSFISLRKVLLPLKNLLKEGGLLIALVKPQFEAGRGSVEKGGVVRDPNIHKAVLDGLIEYAESLSLRVLDLCPSPLDGPKGNREFFLLMENLKDYEAAGREIEEKKERLIRGLGFEV